MIRTRHWLPLATLAVAFIVVLAWPRHVETPPAAPPTPSIEPLPLPEPVAVDEKRGDFSFGRFGDLVVLMPAGTPSSVVLFVSGANGWDAQAYALARPLAQRGALVAGIDFAHFKRVVEYDHGPCVYLSSDFEDLGRAIQSHYKLPSFHSPLLAGVGDGAALAYAILVQQPPGTYAGGVGVGFIPELNIATSLCPAYSMQSHAIAGRKGVFALEPADALPAPWIVFHADGDLRAGIDDAKAFMASMHDGERVIVQGVDASYALTPAWEPAWLAAFARLRTVALQATAPAAQQSLADLQLVEVAATQGSDDRFAVILTGDGGWAGIDREIAAELASRGIPVVGLSTLQYFWTEKTPEQTANDLDRIVRYYLAHWNKRSAMIIGYSFGADVLPFAINRLPDTTRARIDRAAAIAPGTTAEFEFHPASWVSDGDTGLPIAPEIKRLQVPFVCIQDDSGEDACDEADRTKQRVLRLPGGHHFNGDYATLARTVLEPLPGRKP